MTAATPSLTWTACLNAFERELTPQQFSTWIRPLACADDGATLRVMAPNRFVLQWVKERFGARIASLALAATGAPVQVEFGIGIEELHAAKPNAAKAPQAAPFPAAGAPGPTIGRMLPPGTQSVDSSLPDAGRKAPQATSTTTFPMPRKLDANSPRG